MPESEKQLPDEFSKSKRKRESAALQKIGETLVGLPASQLAAIPLPDALRDAVNFARTLKTHESKRRQMQYIGKVMRAIDAEPIILALKKLQWQHQTTVDAFHETEAWRDRLIAEGDEALQALLDSYPELDRQHLRQLIRKAQQDKAKNKDTGAEKALFKYLKEAIHK